MTPEVIPNADTRYLDAMLMDGQKRLKLLPAASYHGIDPIHLRIWCARNARYQIVTQEMVDWIKERVGGRKAVEVGAGMGDLGYHLGIPMSDLHMQKSPEIEAYYRLLGQVPTDPPPDVERLSAEDAVAKYHPKVVIGCWLTQQWRQGDKDGSIYGTDEDVILRGCDTYIHLGNENVHAGKRIRQKQHATIRAMWLVTRAADPARNVVYVWDKESG